jgi:hypothetical protein
VSGRRGKVNKSMFKIRGMLTKLRQAATSELSAHILRPSAT